MMETDERSEDDVEVTPEMIEAGIAAARDIRLGDPLSEIVERIYRAMATARLYLGEMGQ